MPLRQIEILFPPTTYGAALDVDGRPGVVDTWVDVLQDERTSVKILCQSNCTESLLDVVRNRHGHLKGLRILVTTVEATITTRVSTMPETRRKSR